MTFNTQTIYKFIGFKVRLDPLVNPPILPPLILTLRYLQVKWIQSSHIVVTYKNRGEEKNFRKSKLPTNFPLVQLNCQSFPHQILLLQTHVSWHAMFLPIESDMIR